MTSHRCNKEKEITKLITQQTENTQRLKSIEKRLFGNGVKGLICKWDETMDFVMTYKEDIKKIRISLDDSIRNDEKNMLDSMSRKEMLKWFTGLGIAAFAGIIGFIFWIIQFSIKRALHGG